MSVRLHTTCPSGTVCQTAATVNQLAALGCRSRLSSEAQSDHGGEQPVRQRLSAPQLHGADFPDILRPRFRGNFDPDLSNSSSSKAMGTKEQERKPVPQASFICQGEYWTLAFEDRLIRLRDSKGLRHLALLLGEPGREFHVLDLVARIDPREIDASGSQIDPEELAKLTVRSALGEDGGELLDAQARAEYKQRLVELSEELEEAREFSHDEGRVARIKYEIDQVTRQLKNAFGLSGRSQKSGSAAEQARGARFIEYVIADKIRAQDSKSSPARV